MTAATQTATEVKVPDIGDFDDVPVIEVHVKPGDAVNEDDPLITLESDKATMDVPSPAAGAVADVLVKVGDTVSEGTPILMLQPGDGAMTEPPSLVEQQEPRQRPPNQPHRCRAPLPPQLRQPRLRPPLRAQHHLRQKRPTWPESTPAPACGAWPENSASTSALSPVRGRKVGLPRTISWASCADLPRLRRQPPRHPRPARASRRFRPRISPSSDRWRPSRLRVSRRSPARTCTGPG